MKTSEMFTAEELLIRRIWLLIVGLVGLLLATPVTLLIPFHGWFEIFLLSLFLLGSPTSALLSWWLIVHRTKDLDVVHGLKAGLLASLIGFVIVIVGLTLILPVLIIVVFFYALAICIFVVAPVGLALGATFVALEKWSLARLERKKVGTTD
ncbi:hypothetical protein KDW_42520 [Dictyobacter vulcani]|uniref:Uncharacterized protein n=1 Tax=Dictyobacter vulcani TaxID=2607529 RepID=A0A5J4KUE1_9CHLR|nr:hypothetical protein [Dictyobacter vulcani]GER90090.1 hypothetical protein KDW_42520 [Dictyobacter vulcani]